MTSRTRAESVRRLQPWFIVAPYVLNVYQSSPDCVYRVSSFMALAFVSVGTDEDPKLHTACCQLTLSGTSRAGHHEPAYIPRQVGLRRFSVSSAATYIYLNLSALSTFLEARLCLDLKPWPEIWKGQVDPSRPLALWYRCGPSVSTTTRPSASPSQWRSSK